MVMPPKRTEVFSVLKRLFLPREQKPDMLALAARIEHDTSQMREKRVELRERYEQLEQRMGVNSDNVLGHSAQVLMEGKGEDT